MDSVERQLVDPQTLRGFQDYRPGRALAQQKLLAAILPVYQRYGFAPIDTPLLERLDVLVGVGGDEATRSIFTLKTPEDERAGLRFDLTVPFARLIAEHKDELKIPFRRYHVGPVFRADKPDMKNGRFRQFTQCDIDAAGSNSIFVDAEIVAVMAEAFRALGLSPDPADPNAFVVRINNRKVMDAFLSSIGLAGPENLANVLRVVDKLDKVGLEAVQKELTVGRYDESGDFIKGVGLTETQTRRIADFISIKAATRLEVVDALKPHLGEDAEEALAEMRQLAEGLDALGVSEDEAIFDPSLARGLAYYTGPIFETVLRHAPQFGSVMGGGRYDGLVSRFSEDTIPSTGASIGIDRLVTALESLGLVSTNESSVQVLVLSLPGVPEAELLKLAKAFRDEAIATEVYFSDTSRSMRNQLALANARNVAIAVIVGEDELKDATVTIKDLRKRVDGSVTDHAEYVRLSKSGQVRVARDEMLATVRALLAA